MKKEKVRNIKKEHKQIWKKENRKKIHMERKQKKEKSEM